MLRTVAILAALLGVAAGQILQCPACPSTTQKRAYDQADFVGHVHLTSVRSSNGFNFYNAEPKEVFKPMGFARRNITIKQSTDISCGGALLFTNGDYLIAAKRDGADFLTSWCSGIPLVDNTVPVGALVWSTIQLNSNFMNALKTGFTQSSLPMMGGSNGQMPQGNKGGPQLGGGMQQQQNGGGMSSSSSINTPSGSAHSSFNPQSGASSSFNSQQQGGGMSSSFNSNGPQGGASSSFNSQQQPQGGASSSFNSQQQPQGGASSSFHSNGPQGGASSSFNSQQQQGGDSSSSFNSQQQNGGSSSSLHSNGPLGATGAKTTVDSSGTHATFNGPLGDQSFHSSIGQQQ